MLWQRATIFKAMRCNAGFASFADCAFEGFVEHTLTACAAALENVPLLCWLPVLLVGASVRNVAGPEGLLAIGMQLEVSDPSWCVGDDTAELQ